MRNPLHSPAIAVFQNEVLLNSRRVAPYLLMVLFTAHSVLWWGWSAAATHGWGVNSDYNIVRNLMGFSFVLGLPIFNAIIMGDPVIRDFRVGIDPLVFSKPITRWGYICGKFFGNFFVLVCCQSTFMLTALTLQWAPSRVVTLTPRVFPFVKHFFFFVVIPHLFFAAVYFVAGTLSRNAKVVYLLAGSFYPLYIGYQLFVLQHLPQSWQIILDPLIMRSPFGEPWKQSPAWVNQLVIHYSPVMIANRIMIIVAVAVGLALLSFRFTLAKKSTPAVVETLNLVAPTERLSAGGEFPLRRGELILNREAPPRAIPFPQINRLNSGWKSNLEKLLTALKVEFQLLRAERSLIVLAPLSVLISFLSLPFSVAQSGGSASIAFANATLTVWPFFLGVIVFYAGEAMHRDRETRVEGVLWATPAANHVLLLSKFLATLLVAISLAVMIGVTAMVVQVLRGHRPVEISVYLATYLVLLLPGLVFITAASVALNVFLRNKYLAYVVCTAIAAGLFYLYSQGLRHWFYNPLLIQLWDYQSLLGGPNRPVILWHRMYVLGLAGLLLSLAHIFYARKMAHRMAPARMLPALISIGALTVAAFAILAITLR